MKKIKYASIIVFIIVQSFIPLNAQWNQLPGFSGQQILSMVEKDTCIFVGVDFQGVFRSTDVGSSWVQVNTGLTQLTIQSLCVVGTDLFAGTTSGIFKSTNQGNTWTYSGLNGKFVEDIVTRGQNIIAGTNTGVYRSTDNGITWIEKNNGLSNLNVRALFFYGSTLFAGTWVDLEGIFKSTDFGDSWNLSNAGLTSFDVNTIRSVGTEIFAGTNADGIYKSIDSGATWSKADSGLTNPAVGRFVVIDENIFASTYGNGIFLSTNRGVSWSQANTGLTFFYVGPLSVIGSNLYAGTYGSGLYKRQLGNMPIAYNDTSSLSFKSGWNLVSTPIVPYLSSPESVFQSSQSVFGFNNKSKTYNSPADIVTGNAYWTYNFYADSNSFYGSSKDSVVLYVPQSGWVLVGSQFSNIPVANLTSVPSGSVLGDIYRFDSDLGTYQPATQIVPGEGYWVYVLQPCKLKLQ